VLADCHQIADRVPATLPPLPVWLALAEAEHARLTAAADTAERWATATARCDQLALVHHGAYARFRHAQALLDRGSRAQVNQLLLDAHAQADALGAVPLRNDVVALARRANIDLGTKRAATPAEQLGLTPREGEVLELVAAGRTNPRSPNGCTSAPRPPASTSPTSCASSRSPTAEKPQRWHTATASQHAPTDQPSQPTPRRQRERRRAPFRNS
jgi:hypothetical protein